MKKKDLVWVLRNPEEAFALILFLMMNLVLVFRVITSLISRFSLYLLSLSLSPSSDAFWGGIARWISDNGQWTGEGAQWLWVWFVMIGIAGAERAQANLKVDFLFLKLPERFRNPARIILDLVYCGFMVFIVFSCWAQIVRSSRGYPTTLPLSNFWLYFSAAAGFILLGLRLVQRIVKTSLTFSRKRKGEAV